MEFTLAFLPGKDQRFVFPFKVRESPGNKRENCSHLPSIHIFKRSTQFELLAIYRRIL
jgi:hypothetical protein